MIRIVLTPRERRLVHEWNALRKSSGEMIAKWPPYESLELAPSDEVDLCSAWQKRCREIEAQFGASVLFLVLEEGIEITDAGRAALADATGAP
jgi:hypothetical protein